jgi:sulfur-carrier protein
MKRVTLKYFASVREALGTSGESWSTSAISLGQLRSELMARGDSYAACLGREKAVRMALNQTMGDESTLLTDGAEVAFFPPVTGG